MAGYSSVSAKWVGVGMERLGFIFGNLGKDKDFEVKPGLSTSSFPNVSPNIASLGRVLSFRGLFLPRR